MYPDSTVIAVMSGHFMQRGEPSILTKWEKTEIALANGVDIVIELPFPFATQSADIFAHGSMALLNEMHVTKIVFGSEENDREKLYQLAKTQISHPEYDSYVKKYMDEGNSYKSALSKTLQALCGYTVSHANDLLGLSYIREILKYQYPIEAITIQRTNDYYSHHLNGSIVSATAIRSSLEQKRDIRDFVPPLTYQYLNRKMPLWDDLYPFLEYQLSISNHFSQYQGVEEGLEFRMKKAIQKSDSYASFIEHIKTKRYRYQRISRMLTHILTNFTKEEANRMRDPHYIRILGFSKNGKAYLKQIKKETSIPIITRFGDIKDPMLDLELRVTKIYAFAFAQEKRKEIITSEWMRKPLQKDMME